MEINNSSSSIVAGATGLVGNLLIKELVDLGHEVTALCRGKVNSKYDKAVYEVVDYENPQGYGRLFQDKIHLFICLGTTIKKAGSKENFRKVDIDYSYNVAKTAAEFNIPHLSLITSVGADPFSNNFYLKCKGEIEEKVTKLNFKSISIYQPGLLIGKRSEKRLAESLGQFIQPVFIDPFLKGSLKKFKSVKAENLAKSVADNSGKKIGVSYLTYNDFFI